MRCVSKMEIRNRLMAFKNEIFYECDSLEKAKEIKARLKKFIDENGLTASDLDEFTRTGAGEALSMLVP